MYTLFFKRIFDFILSFIAFVLLFPLILIVTILLYIANQGKPFFTQERPGKNAKVFKVIKFKTMNDKRSQDGKLLPDKERLTSFGKFIRSTSLDELPQLLNVIKGDMSLIGPRPLLVKYLPLYTTEQFRRHDVRPGMTGWAQVNGRNAISWEEKFKLDVWYVDNQSFLLDFRIFILTIKKVLFREDINSNNSATIEAFNGKN
jgi:undecaprenyl phosphate N,N'-diacetylbacillosamine 1-phosphate transferase